MVKTVSLGQLITTKGGGTPSKKVEEYWNGDIPWASVKDLKDVTLSETQDYITEAGVKNSSTNIIPEGTVILATRMAVGRVCINKVPVAINQDLRALFCLDNLLPRYLFWFLCSAIDRLEAQASGATVKGITINAIESLEISLPPLEEQRRIAAILDKADELRRKREEAIRLTEELARSRFLDMMKLHSSECKKLTLQEITLQERNSFVNGPFGSNLLTSELKTEGVPVIYIRDIREGYYQRVSKAYVTLQKADQLNTCNVKSGDILVAKVGDPPGITAVYPNFEPDAVVTQDVIRLRLDQGVATSEFVSSYLNSSIGMYKIKHIIVEATRSRFSLTNFKKISIELPDISIQKEFSGFLKHLRSTKVDFVDQERNSHNLFNSLLQRAFKGEL